MTNVDLSNPSALREAGIQALTEALGPLGMIRFLQLFEQGTGDYTKERHLWVKDLDMDTVLRRIRERRKTEPASGASS